MYSPTSRDNILPWPESGVLMLFHPLHPFKEVSKVPTWMYEQLNTTVCEQVRLFRLNVINLRRPVGQKQLLH